MPTAKLEQNSLYRCIQCGGSLSSGEEGLSCNACSIKFRRERGIPLLAERERYWCNIPREDMERLNLDAARGYWKDAVKKHLKENVAEEMAAERRVDFRCILPPLENKRILDVGAMWGSIAIPMARHSGEVHAVDATYETLKFLSIRAEQEKVDNLKIALASCHKLPFADGYFDLTLMIGVLEWLGSNRDFVVKEHYGMTRKERLAKKGNPRALQMEALREVYRTLRPGGNALIAIENRFFYKHFFGSPDPHTAVPFSSVLPRRVADIYMRFMKNQNYLEYTYSYSDYGKMMKEAGFDTLSIYAAIPSYRELDVIVPLEDSKEIKYYYENYGLKEIRGSRSALARIILKMNLMRYFVPSFLIVAEKGR